MNNYKHLLFENIFTETHKELETFNIELEKLCEIYQTNYNSDDESDEDCDNFINNQSSSYSLQLENFEADDCFTKDQIDEFKKIYILHPIQSDCLSNRIDSNIALSRFLKIKAMSNTESNVYFLGMIDTSAKEDNLVNGISKVNLTTNYIFNQKKICQKACIEAKEIKEISLSSFQRIWKRYLPGIKFIIARNNLCMICKTMHFGAKYWYIDETQQKLEE
ncbi:38199_t:CDS:2 [Gigaspora margarita]|uniref:38199_t:CDS:1 n=1 Tax=Gigaspora margarita TaxID=4874 RepID=A0ABN7VDW0_GIGMA|nr:38199_t:CDS:2 [Gigaspora margarita]